MCMGVYKIYPTSIASLKSIVKIEFNNRITTVNCNFYVTKIDNSIYNTWTETGLNDLAAGR
jgi:hypothetical protein